MNDHILIEGLGLTAIFGPVVIFFLRDLLTPNLFLLADYEKIRANREASLGLPDGTLPPVTIDDIPEEAGWRRRNFFVIIGIYAFFYIGLLIPAVPNVDGQAIPLQTILKLMTAWGLVIAIPMTFSGPWDGDFPTRFAGVLLGLLPGIALMWDGGSHVLAGLMLPVIVFASVIVALQPKKWSPKLKRS